MTEPVGTRRSRGAVRNTEIVYRLYDVGLYNNPEIIRQAYYQLAQLYRRMHRAEEAQAALAQFQKLKEEADESQHELLEKKRQRQEQNAADQPVPADNHD